MRDGEGNHGRGIEVGVEAENGGEKGQGGGSGEGSSLEPQGSCQLHPLSHWERQSTSLVTCVGQRHSRPMPKMREVCGVGCR